MKLQVVKKIKINSLDRLLKPENVLVIGGGVWGKSIIFQLKKIGFNGKIYAVHPSPTHLEKFIWVT